MSFWVLEVRNDTSNWERKLDCYQSVPTCLYLVSGVIKLQISCYHVVAENENCNLGSFCVISQIDARLICANFIATYCPRLGGNRPPCWN